MNSSTPSSVSSWRTRVVTLDCTRLSFSAARVTPPACTTERKICRSPRSMRSDHRSQNEMDYIIIIHFTRLKCRRKALPQDPAKPPNQDRDQTEICDDQVQ